ncbi:MAG TPA: MBL fold metallo-hydrolase [Candidatus Eisenbacteria bacterium]|jgi:glyoxylase-like metal-dependent hydrolase (beta-lactamase superfamily II)/8-oxo-dGTP pyrophosphatase MutT (NUDIX family)
MSAKATSSFRDSAAVVLVRGEGRALEVFWVLRSEAVSYMPGFHAFLGGTVAAADREVEIAGAASEEERVLRACAVREAFEEAGVLLALAPDSAPVAAETLAAARRLLLAGETPFAALAREHGWRFRADGLAFAGRWTTPPFASRRFDTAFFLARAPRGQEPAVVPGELAAGEWIAPSEALERWRRGAVSFAAPILHTLRALAAGEEGLAERLARAPEETARPVRRIELKWGIVLQPMKTRPLPPATHTNAYLVGEREMALIDPGSDDPEELAALFALIESLREDGRALKLVLLTHHHPDHVAGVEAVRARYRVPVAAHAETARHLSVDRTLADGEEVALAPGVGEWSLRALHTPGHARGHLCFLHPRTRSLFTGDHIPGGTGTVIVDPPEGDMKAYVASLERLLVEPVETLFPGHGSPQGGAMRRIRWLIAHRLEREAKVVAALGREPAPLATLVERAYADTPRELWDYAERSLLAHLLKLEAEGRAAREGERWRAGG